MPVEQPVSPDLLRHATGRLTPQQARVCLEVRPPLEDGFRAAAGREPFVYVGLTIDHVPGYRVVAILGDVVGATVRPDNPYLEGVKSLSGDAPDIEEIVRTRKEAVAEMMERARLMGANAVIGVRFDHRTIAGKWSEICAYGTAMVLAPRRILRRPA